jgi:beta-galactosidase
MRRNSLAHVARGADGVLFFQWRASRFGVEKHHSAMLPQGGTGTRVWREVSGLGAEIASLGSLRGTVVEPDIALLWDWQSWWAQELDWRPTVDLGYLDRVRAWHESSLRAGLTADFAHPEAAELSRYRVVIAPALYLTTERAAANLRRYVDGGGTLVVSCFSGIVDDRDRVYPGPYPGALRDVLGLTVEEWLPLRAGEQVALTWEEAGLSPEVAGPGLRAASAAVFDRLAGAKPASELMGTADVWTEAVILAGAKPVAWYANGPAAGGPAVTRHDLGEGRAWYVSARTDAASTAAVLAAACDSAGLTPPARPAEPSAPSAARSAAPSAARSAAPSAAHSAAPSGWPRDLELVRRSDGRRRFVTLINHGEAPATVRLPDRIVTVQGGDVQVIAE